MGKKTAVDGTSSSKKRKVSHAGARQKGLAFERWVANQLGHIFEEAERRLESQASKCIGVDLDGTDRIKIQCKNYQGYASVGTIKEIQIKNETDIPVLVTKGNKLEPMAVLPFAKLVTLLEIAYGIELPFRTFDLPEYAQSNRAVEWKGGRSLALEVAPVEIEWPSVMEGASLDSLI